MPVITLTDKGRFALAQEGESCAIPFTLEVDGAAISKDALLTLTAWLYDEATGATINERGTGPEAGQGQDILDTNGGSVTAGGAVRVTLGPADNVIVGDVEPYKYEWHRLLVLWTWHDGVAVQTGIQEFRFPVERLKRAAQVG